MDKYNFINNTFVQLLLPTVRAHINYEQEEQS